MGLAHCLSIHSFIHLAKTAVVSTHPARPPPSCPAPPSLPPPAFVRDLTSTCEMATTGYGRCQSGGRGLGQGLENFWGKEKSSQTDWKPRTGTRKVQRKKENENEKNSIAISETITHSRTPLPPLIQPHPLVQFPAPLGAGVHGRCLLLPPVDVTDHMGTKDGNAVSR